MNDYEKYRRDEEQFANRLAGDARRLAANKNAELNKKDVSDLVMASLLNGDFQAFRWISDFYVGFTQTLRVYKFEDTEARNIAKQTVLALIERSLKSLENSN